MLSYKNLGPQKRPQNPFASAPQVWPPPQLSAAAVSFLALAALGGAAAAAHAGRLGSHSRGRSSPELASTTAMGGSMMTEWLH